MAVSVETFGTASVPEERIEEAVKQVFDFRPARIIRQLDLRKPVYRQVAAYGHFGRKDLDLSWERTDRIQELLQAVHTA